MLTAVSSWNDLVQAFLFRPEPPGADLFRGASGETAALQRLLRDRAGEAGRCRELELELAGLIQDKRAWTAPQMSALPEQELIIRHICVEGWDYIGQWSGVNLRHFLERVGADLTGQVCRVQVRGRLHRQYRHGDGAASARPSLATKHAR